MRLGQSFISSLHAIEHLRHLILNAGGSEKLNPGQFAENNSYKVCYRLVSYMFFRWKELGLGDSPTLKDAVEMAQKVDPYFYQLFKDKKELHMFENTYAFHAEVHAPEMIKPIVQEKIVSKKPVVIRNYIARIGWKGQEICETLPVMAENIKKARLIAKDFIMYAEMRSTEPKQKNTWLTIWPIEKWFKAALKDTGIEIK